MPNTMTPNMGLIVPTVAQEPGPDWATDLNNNLGILDQHDHSSGQGTPVTPAGININSDLGFNANNATGLRTVNFRDLTNSLPGTSPDLGCIYVAGGELYYNDESGNVVQMTKTGSVNAGAGSITGLPSGTASASYAAGTFIWQSATSTAANMDAGSYILRNITAGSKGLTLNPPASMAFNYSLTLPLPPVSTLFMVLDSSGNMGTSTITGAQIEPQSIEQDNLALRPTANPATAGEVAVGTNVTSASTSSTSYVDITGTNITLTTTGRPVLVMINGPGTTGSSFFSIYNNSGGENATGVISINRSGNSISQYAVGIQTTSATLVIPRVDYPSCMLALDFPTAGTYTYNIQWKVDNSGFVLEATNLVVIAYEI